MVAIGNNSSLPSVGFPDSCVFDFLFRSHENVPMNYTSRAQLARLAMNFPRATLNVESN